MALEHLPLCLVAFWQGKIFIGANANGHMRSSLGGVPAMPCMADGRWSINFKMATSRRGDFPLPPMRASRVV
jgi:hypothetical protein